MQFGVDHRVAESAVWNDDAVSASLDSAAYWVEGLPFVKSLSGYWKFHLASNPDAVPHEFHGTCFDDSSWDALPGKLLDFKEFCITLNSDIVYTINCLHL